MPLSDAQKRASKKWDAANSKRISIVLNNSNRVNHEAVKNAADRAEESVNAYIIKAIEQRIEREQ